jgi:hypothetical protein
MLFDFTALKLDILLNEVNISEVLFAGILSAK